MIGPKKKLWNIWKVDKFNIGRWVYFPDSYKYMNLLVETLHSYNISDRTYTAMPYDTKKD